MNERTGRTARYYAGRRRTVNRGGTLAIRLLKPRGSRRYCLMVILEEIKKLSNREALMAMEALWEHLRDGAGGELESPDWHREELEKRDEAVAEGSAVFSDWEEAKERIRARVR